MFFSEQHLNLAGILSKPMQTCREKRLKQRAKEVSTDVAIAPVRPELQ